MMNFLKLSVNKRVGLLTSAAILTASTLQVIEASPASAMGSSSANPAVAQAQFMATNNAQAAEISVFNHINAYRAQHGLPHIVQDNNFASGARGWAQHLTSTGAPAGHPPGGNFYENVAYSNTPERAVILWDASPAHKSNLLERRITRGGVGVVARPDGNYTVVFRAL
ncbi:CAP domain-containing protein [Corynebacterium crudilactis]|uniref:SCP domain-containing protein n=1 Tax=Corynebacterium crudilactis TaxID=1652495 RepID=A0A172QV40_9CORY|nr:CAP domain-containing protein [Corynebacterium crudilactis]ANE04567.1 hypothetical protein ccrud_10380 [Corynebacterium crudilactis]